MLAFDPTAPDFRQNPYPVYAALRSQAPIAFWQERNMWLLSGWEGCSAALRDGRFGNDPVGHDMLFQNPPDHTRLRSLVQKAFTPRRMELLRDRIQAMTNDLLDQMQGNGEIDVIAHLAYPLPVAVIAALLGIPAADHRQFHTWSNALVDSLDLVRDPTLDERLATAESAFRAYFDDLIRVRRRDPQDDLLSALIAAEEAGDRLSGDELYFSARLLLVAGYETTVGLIGNGVLALLRNPDQLRLLQQQPGLIVNATEELLRYDSPIQMVGRMVLQEAEWRGFHFAKGQELALLTGAANHDPAHVDHPDRLDLTRPTIQHLAFGGGIHYCLGAPLARLEGQIAINTLLRRFPKLDLLEETPPHRNNYVFRSLQRLPVAIR
jgi:cytochrome P450